MLFTKVLRSFIENSQELHHHNWHLPFVPLFFHFGPSTYHTGLLGVFGPVCGSPLPLLKWCGTSVSMSLFLSKICSTIAHFTFQSMVSSVFIAIRQLMPYHSEVQKDVVSPVFPCDLRKSY